VDLYEDEREKYSATPSPAYRSNVSRFAPEKFLERIRVKGSIGSRVRRSRTRKATRARVPENRERMTATLPKPALEDSIRP
jgi:hypothetical protein